MYFSPLASALKTILAGLPITIAGGIDASALHELVQQSVNMVKRHMDREGFFHAAQDGKVRRGQFQRRQPQQADYYAGSLSHVEVNHYFD